MKHGIIAALTLLSSYASAQPKVINCQRGDGLDMIRLGGVVKAQIHPRHRGFYSDRIRFYNKDDEQVETCSFQFDRFDVSECRSAGGIQGEWDQLRMLLYVIKFEDSETSDLYKTPFALRVRLVSQEGYVSRRALRFLCLPVL